METLLRTLPWMIILFVFITIIRVFVEAIRIAAERNSEYDTGEAGEIEDDFEEWATNCRIGKDNIFTDPTYSGISGNLYNSDD